MAQTLISCQNLTATPQKCFWNGRIYTIQPYQVREFVDDIAYAFFEQRSSWVVEYKPIELPEPRPGDRLVWIANNTGNPFLPPTVRLRRFRKGQEEFLEEPNPVRNPVVVQRTLCRGQTIQPARNDPQSDESISHGHQRIMIPPYTRACVADPLAQWLLRRDSLQEPQHRGKLVMSRAPTDCDPNVSWGLMELQVLAGIMEVGQELMGPHEDELRHRLDGADLDLSLLKAKQDLLYTLFFRLIDERYWQPSADEFKAYLKEAEDQARGVQLPKVPDVAPQAPVKEPAAAMVEEEPRRKRGRPPKKKAPMAVPTQEITGG